MDLGYEIRVDALECKPASARAYKCASVRAWVLACVSACVRLRDTQSVYVLARVHLCVNACKPACVHA